MRHLLLLVALVLLLSPEAYAQERGQTGITFGPNAFGFVFQVTDRVAIRPEAALAVTSSDTLDLTTWDAGLSTLFYVYGEVGLSFRQTRTSTSGPGISVSAS